MSVSPENTEVLEDVIGRVLYDFMRMLDEHNCVMNKVLHTEMIELSVAQNTLNTEPNETGQALGIYVDVAVPIHNDLVSHTVIRDILSSDSITVDLDDRREATLNYFLLNPDLYAPSDTGTYHLQISENVPIVLSSYEDATFFEHEPLHIDVLKERKNDGVLSEQTFYEIKGGDIATFPALILLSL